MRKSLLYPAYLLLGASMLLATSCDIEDVEADDGAIVFELYDTEGALVEGLQSMKFGTTTAYTLKSAFVTYTEITAPAGWKCSVIPSSRSCTVTAPVASDLEARAGGDIVVAITSQAGRTMNYTLSVAALEESISLTFDGDATTKNHIFSYGKSFVFPFSCENTSSLEVEAPEGWTTETDLENNRLTVTAPMPDSQNPALTGAVKVTPLSVRGTAGAPSSINVELSTKMPVIQFAEPIGRFAFGEQRDIPCTLQYVAQCDITAPEGWTVALDVDASVLKVTAPAEEAGIPAGTVTLDAVSAEELTESFETYLSLKGIATGDDFVAFGKAVSDGTPLDAFMQEGAVVLLQNVDLSAFTQTCFVGSAENPFKGPFDGKGNTLTVNLNDGDAKELGLFHTLDASATVKNLTLAGSMTVSRPEPGVAGTLAVYNTGAALTNVTNTATVNYAGAKTSATAGYLGGLIGQDKAGSTYTDCRNTGAFLITGTGRTMFIGGIVGGAALGTNGSIVGCSNSGNFEFNLSGAADSGMYGGLIGSAEKTAWNYTDCTNEGNFTVMLADPGHQFNSLGGIVGNAYGTFANCVNKGKITFGASNGTKYRRTGGIVGCVGADKKSNEVFDRLLKMTDCRNEGDLAASTASLGGIIGIAEKIDAPALIENCINTGHISSPSMADFDVFYFGGIAGKVNGAFTLRNCVNHGNLTAAVERDMAGIAVSGGNGAAFENCENYGNITVAPNHKPNEGDRWRPCVAGITAIENDVTTTIVNCTSSCVIDATVYRATSIDRLYVFQKTWEKGTEDKKTVCDEASKNNSAGTTLNIIIRE